MARKEIVAEIKSRGKRPAGLLPAEPWMALARAINPCESLSHPPGH
jgi:hypothetical protein